MNKKHDKIFNAVSRAEEHIRQTVVNAKAIKEFADLQNKKILIVDDDKSFSDFILLKLKNVGDFELKTASDAGWGLKKVIEDRPDLLILDIFLPESDGIKLAKAMNCLYETEFPIIFVSGDKSFQKEIENENFKGNIRFLHKPIDKNLLEKYVHDLLKK